MNNIRIVLYYDEWRVQQREEFKLFPRLIYHIGWKVAFERGAENRQILVSNVRDSGVISCVLSDWIFRTLNMMNLNMKMPKTFPQWK